VRGWKTGSEDHRETSGTPPGAHEEPATAAGLNRVLPPLVQSSVGRLYLVAVGTIAAATVVALVVLWPTQGRTSGLAGFAATESGTVTRIAEFPCPGPQTDHCRRAAVRLEGGDDAGRIVAVELGTGGLDPELELGDKVRVSKDVAPPGAPGGTLYSLADFERRTPMLWLALAFAVLVVLLGRLRGALSVLGLGVSIAVVLAFILPAILGGGPPLAVAIAGASAIMLATILLAHGVNAKSLAAVLGTTASLFLTAALAVVFTELAHLTGFATEEAVFLQTGEADVSLAGLLIAGMVIAALGVLDDLTISQASTVMALHAARPEQRFSELYKRGLAVGRDHVTATVNTLVLAYVGASLPVLLVLTLGEVGTLEAVNFEIVAKEIVATLVGSIGLIAAVPVTTALAALLPARAAVASDSHGHGH
jgi:uncharacterized membrane protein